MFENVREWLRKGRSEKVIGFLILFIAVYGILWGLVEPLISSEIVEKYFGIDAVKHWWKYQILLSLVASIVLYIWLYPNKIIQKFGSEILDTNLNSGFISIGSPNISLVNDGYYGDVFYIKGDAKKDALDWSVMSKADHASSVSYIFQPINRFTLYLRINMLSKNKSKEKLGWLTLRTDISLPLGGKNQEEWAYPVKGRDAKYGWIMVQVNIPKAVEATFGQEGWQYDKLKSIRIRGEGKVYAIEIRGGY